RSPCRTAAVRTIDMMAWTRCRRFGSEDAGPTTAGDDSGQGKPRLAQGPRQGDQRQAYQGGRVLAADGGEQADAQPLALEAAGAIVGLLGLEIAADLRLVQVAEDHLGEVAVFEAAFVAGTQQAEGGMEAQPSAGSGLQLGEGGLGIARLAQGLAVAFGHLVRADHPGTRM